jgi:tRNA1(Val) A37 N6-methylase TrmN6
LAQPETGYRAGIDPVLLAAACPAQTGQEVLELGCGVGVASLCLGWRVPGLALSGVEIMGDYAQIARENAARMISNLTCVREMSRHGRRRFMTGVFIM